MPLTLRVDGRSVLLDSTVSAGASKSCVLCLPKLKETHATFDTTDELVWIAPIDGSEIVVNGAPVLSRRLLGDGDRVRLGPYEGTLAHEEPVAALQTAELALAIMQRASGAASPCVMVVEGPQAGVRLELAEEGRSYTLGRGAGCDLQVDDESVSRDHLRVFARRGSVLVRDLDSARGTYLAEARIESQRDAEWHVGKALRIGRVVLRIDVPVSIEEVAAGLVPVVDQSPVEVDGKVVEVESVPVKPPPGGAVAAMVAAPVGKVAVRRAPRMNISRLVPAAIVLVLVAGLGTIVWLVSTTR